MENTITLTAEEQLKKDLTRNLILYIKAQLKNYMIVMRAFNNKKMSIDDYNEIKKNHPYDSIFNNSINITLLHIIYNRLRRGERRPHLESVERENQLISKNKYWIDKINQLFNKKGWEGLYENVYNG